MCEISEATANKLYKTFGGLSKPSLDTSQSFKDLHISIIKNNILNIRLSLGNYYLKLINSNIFTRWYYKRKIAKLNLYLTIMNEVLNKLQNG